MALALCFVDDVVNDLLLSCLLCPQEASYIIRLLDYIKLWHPARRNVLIMNLKMLKFNYLKDKSKIINKYCVFKIFRCDVDGTQANRNDNSNSSSGKSTI